LTPGSTLTIYSDGVTDILNEEKQAFGFDGLREIVAANLTATAEDLRKKIFEATMTHKGQAEQFDDYTLVVIKAL
jgi:sigma-B regulation protein RsbU (phosphoserine phosphatase)